MQLHRAYLQLRIICSYQKEVTEIKLSEAEKNLQQHLLILKGEKNIF